jgi:hypothetical protein
MDADDVALPRRLELQVAALDTDPTLAACGGQVDLFLAETSATACAATNAG